MTRTNLVIDERTVHSNLQEIVDASLDVSLNYAINYARAGMKMTGHELVVQCLYVLNNISRWRHPRAKEIRQNLKDFTKHAR